MNVAIIPARSGSKGVPNKNIYKFWDKPLIAWASLCAQATGLIDRVILSTDSQEYANIGLENGCEVPFLRDTNLASDKSNINDVLRDIIEKCDPNREWKTFSLLEPTCPLRTPEMVANCIEPLLEDGNVHSCITVSGVPVKYHPFKQFALGEDGSLEFLHSKGKTTVNRQEISKSYIRNGACYSVNVEHFLNTGNIIGPTTKPNIIKDYLINIDHQKDIDNLIRIQQTTKMPEWVKNL